jgi:hypothetical protein
VLWLHHGGIFDIFGSPNFLEPMSDLVVGGSRYETDRC